MKLHWNAIVTLFWRVELFSLTKNTLFVLVSKILFIHLYILEWRFPYLQAILMIKSYFHIGLINPSSPVLKNQKTYKADILNKHLEEDELC